MYCKHCRKEIPDPYAVVCPHCCKSLNNDTYEKSHRNHSNVTGARLGTFLISLLCPLFGMFLWLGWKDDEPGKAQMAMVGTVLGIIATYVLCIIAVDKYIIKPKQDTMKELEELIKTLK